ncbi:hypothetical protein Tco_0446612 [Tanacetum coccineum]
MRFLLIVLKIFYVLDPLLAPILANPITAEGEEVDQNEVLELEKQRMRLIVLSIPIPEILQVGAIVSKLPQLWNDISKKLINKKDDYSLDNLLKHLRIKEEDRN